MVVIAALVMQLYLRRFLNLYVAAAFLLTPSAEAGLHLHGGVGGSSLVGGILLNLGEPQYFSGGTPFLNWWKSGSTLVLVSGTNGTLTGRQIWDNGTYLLTSTGELKNPVPADVTSIAKGIFTQVSFPTFQYEGTAFANFAGQQFDVIWSGCANPTPSVNNLGVGGTSSFGSNSGTFTFGSSGYNNVALTFSPNASGCTNNPPTNIKVFQHEYATNVANGELTNPDWRATVRPFAFLRMMDFMGINGSGITDSSQLAPLIYSSYVGFLNVAYASTASSISGGVLTASGEFGQLWQVGMKLTCEGCTNAMSIASFGTGTGGDGTYNLTCTPSCNTISGKNVLGVPPVGQNGESGPKGAMGPDIVCALANEIGTNIEYPIPITATNQYVTDIATALKACTTKVVKFSYGNENWNFGFAQFAYVGALAANTSLASGNNYSGYRAAQIFDIIQGVYGSNSGAGRWIGAFGTFNAIPGTGDAVIAGAKTAITNGSLHSLTQLASQIDTAPYTGDFYGAALITNISVGATPTVTAQNDNGAGSPLLANGQVIKLFVTGGTMAAALNNQYATVSSATTTSFVINISTVGLTYGASGSDIAVDGTFFKLADRAATLNGSTPATYPTKFSYFTQQLSKAILNGTASDASYGTINIGGNLSNNTGALPDLLNQHALLANANGLQLGQYEGGNTISMSGTLQAHPPAQLMEYFINWQFDNGVTGDSTNTEGGIETAVFNTTCSLTAGYSSYPAQFTDAGPQSQFGPWGALRFIPGDTSNIKWATIASYNSGHNACVDPTPPATWTTSFPGTANNRFFGSSGCSPCTDTLANAIIGTAATSVKILVTLTGGSMTSVTCDGVTVSTPDVVSTAGGRLASIYTVAVGAGSNTRNCNMINSGAGFQFREFYVVTASGLGSPSPVATATGSNNTSITYHKGDLTISVAACNGAFTNTTGVTPAGGTPSTTTVFSDIDTVNGTAEMAAFSWPFSSTKFNVGSGCAGDLAVATYH